MRFRQAHGKQLLGWGLVLCATLGLGVGCSGSGQRSASGSIFAASSEEQEAAERAEEQRRQREAERAAAEEAAAQLEASRVEAARREAVRAREAGLQADTLGVLPDVDLPWISDSLGIAVVGETGPDVWDPRRPDSLAAGARPDGAPWDVGPIGDPSDSLSITSAARALESFRSAAPGGAFEDSSGLAVPAPHPSPDFVGPIGPLAADTAVADSSLPAAGSRFFDEDFLSTDYTEAGDRAVSYSTPPERRIYGSDASLWRFTEGASPAGDAFLYHLYRRRFSRDIVLQEQWLPQRQRAFMDSLRFRPFAYAMQLKAPSNAQTVAQQVTVDVENERVRIARIYAETQVEPPVEMSMQEYANRLTTRSMHTLWAEAMVRTLRDPDAARNVGGLVSVDIPFEIPSQLSSVFGKGKPNLSVNGSERITFAGTSRWKPNQLQDEIGGRPSKFPQLNMEQQLNLRLTGTIGDKVNVDVDQTSNSPTPLANRIKIKYNGYDDEIIQRVDLGNTSLRLPGTRYVTFNGRAEGLFGINALAKVGDVDFNMILTKQEGRNESKSVERSAETRTISIDDLDYVHSKYFFVRDPDDCPWRIDTSSLQVYLDDKDGSNNVEDGAFTAFATLDGDHEGESSRRYRGSFHLLEFETDYIIQEEFYTGHPLLILNRTLNSSDVLAVAYQGTLLEQRPDGEFLVTGPRFTAGDLINGPIPDSLFLKMVRPTRADGTVDVTDLTKGPWAPIRNLELRNIYDLGARNILEEGLDVKVRLKATTGAGTENPDRLPDGTTFLRLFGLDRSNDAGGVLEPGPDGRVDNEYIRLSRGLLVFPDLRPFDPTPSDLCLESAACGNSTSFGYCRVDPTGTRQYDPRIPFPSSPSDSATYRAPGIYDKLTYNTEAEVSRYFIEVTFRSPVTNIQLNAFSILPESEVVTASGRRLQRDIHYTIDYDIGEVEILDAANVTELDKLEVTYSFLPFAGAGGSKTLGGVSAFVAPEESKWKASSTWLYESKGGVPGLEGRRPRLGEEPSRTLVGEFAMLYDTESWLLTDLVDELPFLDARAPSRVSIDTGVGLSLPNPNTRNQLYIDDFEGAEDVLGINMSRRSWRFTSIPVPVLEAASRDVLLATERKGELWWYSPRATVQEWDLQPTLEPREGDDNRQIIELKFFPRGATPLEAETSWSGITQPLSRGGMDLSRAEFLDIWINDFVPYEQKEQRQGKLVIDLGTVSEDAVWYRNDPARPDLYRAVPPNGRFDTEDKNRDTRLDSGDLREDAGLDTLFNGTAGDDPFDDYRFDDSLDDDNPRKYAFINGTEANQVLDTEDLNGDNDLQLLDSYFQIELDLADSTLWETDVRRDFVVNDPGEQLSQIPDLDNGWRRLRIPLANDSLVSIMKGTLGDPDPAWEKIFHSRVWITGFSDTTRIQIAGFEIVGNRWFENEMRNLADRRLAPGSLAPGEEFFVGVLNNKDDRAVYSPPFTPDRRTEDNLQEREQSITIELIDFQPGHKASIYKTFPRPQDYSSLYEQMELFLNRRFERGRADLAFSIRLCKDANSDTTNYYEYRLPAPSNWHLAEIDFAQLSQLQLEEPDERTGIIRQELGNGVSIARKGSPSLNSVSRLAFAVENVGSTPLARGNVWIDELRLNGVKRNTGVASRFAIDGNLSDFSSFNFNLERTGADFLKIGQDRGSGITTTAWNARGSFALAKFVEGHGIQLPLDVTMRSSKSVPKFQTNSDLVVETPTDRDITERTEQQIGFRYSKRRSESPFLRYLVDPFSVSGNYSKITDARPTVRDTTVTRQGSVAWSMPLEGVAPISLGGRRQLNLLPTSLSATLTGNRTESSHYTRSNLFEDYSAEDRPDRSNTTLNLGGALRPINGVNYTVASARNLNLRENQLRFAGIGLGREQGRSQSLGASYEIPVLRTILAPRVTWNGESRLTFLKQGATNEGEPTRYEDFNNRRTTRFSGRLSLRDLGNWVTGLVGGGDSDSVRQARARPRGASNHGVSVGPISVNYSLTSNTSFDRVKGTPNLLYQLGVSGNPGGGVRSISRADSSSGDGSQLTFGTNISLPFAITVNPSYSRDASDGTVRGAATRSKIVVWPDFDISWGQLHSKLGLDRLLRLRSLSARTAYTKRFEETGSQGRARDRTTESVNMAPLVNIQATLQSGLQATLDTSFSRQTAQSYTGILSTNLNESRSFNFSVKKTLNLTRRIKIGDREQVLQTRMTVNAGIDYRTNRNETLTAGAAPVVSRDTANLKLSGSSSYQFTDRITGSATLDVGQDTDRKNSANTFRFVGLSVSANFTF